MNGLINYLAHKESWTLQDVEKFLEDEVVKRKNVLLFKKVSPYISKAIMQGTNRLDMSNEEFHQFKQICLKICGYPPHDEFLPQLDISSREIVSNYLHSLPLPNLDKTKILQEMKL